MTQGIGLEEAGVELTKRNKVVVDKKFKTTADGIYAIGDIIDGPMLAHKVRHCQAPLLGQLASHRLGLCLVRDKPLLPQCTAQQSRLQAGRQECEALCSWLACLHRGHQLQCREACWTKLPRACLRHCLAIFSYLHRPRACQACSRCMHHPMC